MVATGNFSFRSGGGVLGGGVLGGRAPGGGETRLARGELGQDVVGAYKDERGLDAEDVVDVSCSVLYIKSVFQSG